VLFTSTVKKPQERFGHEKKDYRSIRLDLCHPAADGLQPGQDIRGRDGKL
jgi:hypothetical protein